MEQDDSFKITPPHYVKNLFVAVAAAVGKFGPAWVMAGLLGFGMYQLSTRVMDRSDKREDAFLKALDSLDSLQSMFGSHMTTSERTQLFISVTCAAQANTPETKRACFDWMKAQEMKDRAINR